ncbi:MAG TPA: flagellar motor switch protein FliG [Verrucomicrobiae bacterium]|nr:flagellar motor switch protein FliG [Verrucomicrobiae bacterium]
MTTAEPTNPSTEISRLSKIQKLAILLIILGPESAAQVLKHLDEHELEAVSGEMSRQSLVSHEIQVEILREFSGVALQASTSVRGGIDYAQTTLEKAVGVFKASHVINRLAPSRPPVGSMQKLIELDARNIFNLLKQEQPQTVALITSYLPPEKASEVLAMLKPEQRDIVIERLATLSATPIEVVERAVEVLASKMSAKPTRALNQTGGIKTAADILNALDKNTSKTILSSIEERNAELGAMIRKKMFTFEDLINIDLSGLQKIMREVDIRDLAVALKTASEQLKTTLLGAISRRAAETVQEEMSFLGSLKLKEIEAAQMRIIDVVRRLETEGEVELERGKEENVVFAT